MPDGQAAPLSEDYNRIETVMPNPVVADLDGDGRPEILYSSYDGRLHAYWLDRTEHGQWPYRVKKTSESYIRFSSEPAVADLDNDGQAEVIVATWTQKGSNAGGQLMILSWDGALLHAVDLPRSSQDWDGAMAAPTIDNIDADRELRGRRRHGAHRAGRVRPAGLSQCAHPVGHRAREHSAQRAGEGDRRRDGLRALAGCLAVTERWPVLQ